MSRYSNVVKCHYCGQYNVKVVMEHDDFGALTCPECWVDVLQEMPKAHRIELFIERLPRKVLLAVALGGMTIAVLLTIYIIGGMI